MTIGRHSARRGHIKHDLVSLLERAAAPADTAGRGQVWVKTATPNELWFTDDAGTDHQLGTGGGTPTQITVADESTDTTCFPLFVTAVTGDLGPKTGTNLLFDSNIGDLVPTLLAGIAVANLVDKGAAETIAAEWDFTTNPKIDAAGIDTGTFAAGRIPIPTAITVADESTDTTCFPLFSTAATGDLGPKSGTNLLFNSNTGDLTATLIAGIVAASLVDKTAAEVITGHWHHPATLNTQDGNYTLVLEDAGKTVHKAGGGAGETYTIPANSSVAFVIGTMIAINNDGGGSLTIAITTDTLTWSADNTTGSRTLADGGTCVLLKVTATLWKIAGSKLLT